MLQLIRQLRFQTLTKFASAICIVSLCCSAVFSQAEYDIAITGLNIVNVETGEIVEGQTLLIVGDRIEQIVPNGTFKSSATELHDFSGYYAIPGLWDMHVHFRGLGLEEENKILLNHYLGYGVTAVRDAGGDLSEEVMLWRDRINSGSLIGPRIFTSLQKFDGQHSTWSGSIPIVTNDDFFPAIESLLPKNPDFFKIYVSSLSGERFIPLIRAIKGTGYKVSAHLHMGVSFEESIDAGLNGVEHAIFLLKATSEFDKAISNDILENGLRADPFRKYIDSFDREYALSMFQRMAEAGTAAIPTLYPLHVMAFIDQVDHRDDEVLNYIPEAIKATYRARVFSASNRTSSEVSAEHERTEKAMLLMPLLREAGVLILAGSDSGAFNSYIYPGDSLHRELELLVDSGLLPLDALQAATINAARWMDLEEHYGTLESGKVADVVILRENPLDGISATREISALIKNGSFHSSEALGELRAAK